MLKNKNGTIYLFILVFLFIGAVTYVGYMDSSGIGKVPVIPKAEITLTVAPTAGPTPSTNAGDINKPIVTSPVRDTKVKTPLTIKGTVPAGWMFEGVFPILIRDSEGGIIAQTAAQEITPGSWQSGNPVEFEATITFPSRPGRGRIILQNDNPSGLPEKTLTFEVPVILE